MQRVFSSIFLTVFCLQVAARAEVHEIATPPSRALVHPEAYGRVKANLQALSDRCAEIKLTRFKTFEEVLTAYRKAKLPEEEFGAEGRGNYDRSFGILSSSTLEGFPSFMKKWPAKLLKKALR